MRTAAKWFCRIVSIAWFSFVVAVLVLPKERVDEAIGDRKWWVMVGLIVATAILIFGQFFDEDRRFGLYLMIHVHCAGEMPKRIFVGRFDTDEERSRFEEKWMVRLTLKPPPAQVVWIQFFSREYLMPWEKPIAPDQFIGV